MRGMDIDPSEKNANFATRSLAVNSSTFLFCPSSPPQEPPYRHDFKVHFLPVNCYGCGVRFDLRPTTADKIPASKQPFYFYNEKVYCSSACRQGIINVELPCLASKDDANRSAPARRS